MIKRKAVLPLAAVAVAAVAVPTIASGRSASATAVTTQTVKVAGTGNSGYFGWAGATGIPPTLTFKLGAKRVQWVWDNVKGTSDHDVTFQTSGSVSLTAAQKPKNSLTRPVLPGGPSVRGGTNHYEWPAVAWTPPKVGTYVFYCTKHPGGGLTHTGGMWMKVVVTK